MTRILAFPDYAGQKEPETVKENKFRPKQSDTPTYLHCWSVRNNLGVKTENKIA